MLLGSKLARSFTERMACAGELMPPSRARTRRYAVHATMVVGCLPIFTKWRVGGALLSLEDAAIAEGGVTALRFVGGSWPERLKGFNRFGMTEETVRMEHGAIAESSYLGFMTSCPEKNLHEAEAAFPAATEKLPLTIAYGKATRQEP